MTFLSRLSGSSFLVVFASQLCNRIFIIVSSDHVLLTPWVVPSALPATDFTSVLSQVLVKFFQAAVHKKILDNINENHFCLIKSISHSSDPSSMPFIDSLQ